MNNVPQEVKDKVFALVKQYSDMLYDLGDVPQEEREHPQAQHLSDEMYVQTMWALSRAIIASTNWGYGGAPCPDDLMAWPIADEHKPLLDNLNEYGV